MPLVGFKLFTVILELKESPDLDLVLFNFSSFLKFKIYSKNWNFMFNSLNKFRKGSKKSFKFPIQRFHPIHPQ